MKLMAASMPHHDASMAYFDGHQLRYLKLERTQQEKRFSCKALNEWQREAQSTWAIDSLAVDDAVFTFDPTSLPKQLHPYFQPDLFARFAGGQSIAERLHPRICDFLGVKRGWMISHHYAHAQSTWMLEENPPQVQVVIDGLGDSRPWSVYRGDVLVAAGDIRNGSIGWGIREAGKLLDIQYGHYNDIAGKVMGLQSYGRVDPAYARFLGGFSFLQIKEIWSVKHWNAYKGDAHVGKLTLLDWVATVHSIMGRMIVDFVSQFANSGDTISYTGGVAQNVVWNTLLREHFPKLLVPPHASDEGLSLGAIEWLRRRHGLGRLAFADFPFAQTDAGLPPPTDQTIDRAAHLLADGKVVGWYQGNGEVGPRALGNRSILMDPRIRQGKDLINGVKRRENYRPFGASVLRTHFSDYFDGTADPYMLYSSRLKDELHFPVITHVDNTCRVQLVDDTNAVFERLMRRFFELTGCAVLTNTSLNVAGKPIAGSPGDARQVFLETPIDAMVIGDDVLTRAASIR